MKGLDVRMTALSVALCLPFAAAGQSDDVQADTVMGCIYSVGEFGAELVEICRKENLAAAQALRDYPKQHGHIIQSCSRRVMGSSGWAGVKLCADQDIEAQAALRGYPVEHHGLIAECEAQNAARGPSKIRACVDQRLSGPQ